MPNKDQRGGMRIDQEAAFTMGNRLVLRAERLAEDAVQTRIDFETQDHA